MRLLVGARARRGSRRRRPAAASALEALERRPSAGTVLAAAIVARSPRAVWQGPRHGSGVRGVRQAPLFGMTISHSHRRTKRRWNPNIQRVRALVERLAQARPRLHVVHQGRQGREGRPLGLASGPPRSANRSRPASLRSRRARAPAPPRAWASAIAASRSANTWFCMGEVVERADRAEHRRCSGDAPFISTVIPRCSRSAMISPSACAPVASSTWSCGQAQDHDADVADVGELGQEPLAAPKNSAPSSR